jgi:tetratricopeptide (TPR) repeat protein
VGEQTHDPFSTFDMLLHKRDYRRAEVLVAKQLRVVSDTPIRIRWLVARARLRMQNNRVDDALLDLEKIRTLQGGEIADPDLLLLFADTHLARYELATIGFADKADVEKAHHYCQQIIETYPSFDNLGWARYQLGRVLLIEYRIDGAVACFQSALLEASTRPALTAYCYERLGFINFYEMRQLENALQFFSKAVDTYPKTEPVHWLIHVHILRSRVLRELNRTEDAVDAARLAVNIAASIDMKHILADALLTISEMLSSEPGRERETIAALQQFLQISKRPLGIDVTWARVHEMLGDAWYRSGHFVNAIAAFSAAITYNPYSPWEGSLHYRLARSAYQAGEFRRALQALDRMTKIIEADGEMQVDHHTDMLRGGCHFALTQYREAAAAYRRALDHTPPGDPDRAIIEQYYQIASELAQKS